MPRTPDEFPGERIEDSILFLSGSDYPLVNGQVTYVSGVGFRFLDEGILKGLSTESGTGSLTPSDHRELRQLVHFVSDGPAPGMLTGAYKEILPGGSPFPTTLIWWTSPLKIAKFLQLEITRSGIFPITESWKLFDTSGTTVVESLTDEIQYSGPFEISRTRTMT